jgi:hypothetical protein
MALQSLEPELSAHPTTTGARTHKSMLFCCDGGKDALCKTAESVSSQPVEDGLLLADKDELAARPHVEASHRRDQMGR